MRQAQIPNQETCTALQTSLFFVKDTRIETNYINCFSNLNFSHERRIFVDVYANLCQIAFTIDSAVSPAKFHVSSTINNEVMLFGHVIFSQNLNTSTKLKMIEIEIKVDTVGYWRMNDGGKQAIAANNILVK